MTMTACMDDVAGLQARVAAMAVETAVIDYSTVEVGFAVLLEARVASRTRAQLELEAARIGLPDATTRRILDSWQARAELIGQSHAILKALVRRPDILEMLADDIAEIVQERAR